jgi:hypothetical protein
VLLPGDRILHRQPDRRFEGGAQGGHKLARGFLPVRTHSLHWIADPDFAEAIGEFLRREQSDIGQVLDELHESSPYKTARRQIAAASIARASPSLLDSADTLRGNRTMDASRTLKNRTLFISGGSRGIGLAIAIRAAQDGANVVIAAKTTEPHPKLPGTIYSAAEDIERAGGQALPLVVDIRDEGAGAVGGCAERCRKFGRIDILGQQRERDQPDRHAADADEALRPDVRRRRARHVRCARRRACRSSSSRPRPAAVRIS